MESVGLADAYRYGTKLVGYLLVVLAFGGIPAGAGAYVVRDERGSLTSLSAGSLTDPYVAIGVLLVVAGVVVSLAGLFGLLYKTIADGAAVGALRGVEAGDSPVADSTEDEPVADEEAGATESEPDDGTATTDPLADDDSPSDSPDTPTPVPTTDPSLADREAEESPEDRSVAEAYDLTETDEPDPETGGDHPDRPAEASDTPAEAEARAGDSVPAEDPADAVTGVEPATEVGQRAEAGAPDEAPVDQPDEEPADAPDEGAENEPPEWTPPDPEEIEGTGPAASDVEDDGNPESTDEAADPTGDATAESDDAVRTWNDVQGESESVEPAETDDEDPFVSPGETVDVSEQSDPADQPLDDPGIGVEPVESDPAEDADRSVDDVIAEGDLIVDDGVVDPDPGGVDPDSDPASGDPFEGEPKPDPTGGPADADEGDDKVDDGTSVTDVSGEDEGTSGEGVPSFESESDDDPLDDFLG